MNFSGISEFLKMKDIVSLGGGRALETLKLVKALETLNKLVLVACKKE